MIHAEATLLYCLYLTRNILNESSLPNHNIYLYLKQTKLSLKIQISPSYNLLKQKIQVFFLKKH